MKTIAILFAFLPLICLSQDHFNNPKNLPFTWKTDTLKKIVPVSEISIVLPKGSFPKLNFPKFLQKKEGLQIFYKNEPVLAVVVNGQAKAYPLTMLTSYEISNDTLGGKPILATYCPLCNSGIVYNRILTTAGKSQLLEFEVSGMLRNSDMVMLDTKTETLWQQFTGEAIVGQFAGATLEIIPSVVISVADFFNRYPAGLIVSKNSGQFVTNHYKNYDNINNTPYKRYFESKKLDDRLPPMERIIDIEFQGNYKIYPFSVLETKQVINDSFYSKKIVVFYKKGTVSILDKEQIKDSKDIGSATVYSRLLDGKTYTFKKGKQQEFIDQETNSKWDITGFCFEGELKGKQLVIEPHGNHFAFAWLAFHPNSEIYK
jgi:hypothetical protein